MSFHKFIGADNQINDFGVRLALLLEKDLAKFCISPAGVSLNLAISAVGAMGETKKQILQALAIEAKDSFFIKYGNLLENLKKEKPNTNLKNAVLTKNIGSVSPNYTGLIQSEFKADIIDFCTEDINKWFSKNLKYELPTFERMSKGASFVSTASFQGKFAVPFLRENNFDGFFFAENDRTRRASPFSLDMG